MGLFENTVAGIMSDSNPLLDSYTRKKEKEANDIATAQDKQQRALETGYQSNRDLLASPGKLDRMVVDNTSDIYPYVKKPSMKDAEIRTDAVDKGMGDNPLAGSTTAIKAKFSQALADPRYAGVSQAQLLDVVKKDHLSSKDADGVSLLDKAHKYKYEKDNGPFRFFSDKGDDSVVALPGYDKYKADARAAKPYDTSLAEAVAMNVGFTALAVGAGIVTGGTAVPAVIAGRLAVSAALAYPEMKVFDSAANAMSKNRTTEEGTGGNLLAELAVGAASLLVAHKVVGGGMGAALSKAMKNEKTAEVAATLAGYTGTATKALESFKAGKAANAATERARVLGIEETAKLRVAHKENVLAGMDEEAAAFNAELKSVGTPEASMFLNDRLTKLRIAPEAAHVMGLDEGMYKAAQAKPSTLAAHISDEGFDTVERLIAEGSTQEMAVVQVFNQEAALRKLALQETMTAEEISKQAHKALKVPTFSELMYSEGKVGKGASGSTGSKIKSVSINMGGKLKPEAKSPTFQEMMVGDDVAGVAKGTEGNIKIEPINMGAKEIAPEVPSVQKALTHNELLAGTNVSATSKSVGSKIAAPLVDIEAKSANKATANGGLGKLGAAAVATVATGGLLAGTADDSEAGTIDAVMKASGKIFASTAESALKVDKFPSSVTVQGESLWNAFKKFGTTKAEFTDLGLDKIKPGTKVTKQELSKIVEEKGLKIGEDVYGSTQLDKTKYKELIDHIKVNEPEYFGYDSAKQAADALVYEDAFADIAWKGTASRDKIDNILYELTKEGKQPQFSGYKAMKSEEGVVPGSYREEFVTAERAYVNPLSLAEQAEYERIRNLSRGEKTITDATRGQELQDKIGTADATWKDPHTNYNSTENPIGRFRYDVQVQPDGKKVMRIQEVQQGFKDTDPNVPQSLRDRWQEITVKKAIARAKAEGVDGISWATGEQQRSLYDNALRNVADEARYNPVTKEFTVLKNGRTVDGYPKVVEPDGIAEHIGKDPAKRLLESTINDEVVTWAKTGDYGDIVSSDGKFVINTGNSSRYVLRGSRSGNIIAKSDNLDYLKSLHAEQDVTKSHVITDLAMDAQWPGKLYGDFAESVPAPKWIENTKYSAVDTSNGKRLFVNKEANGWNVTESTQFQADEKVIGADFSTREEAKKFVETMRASVLDTTPSGNFNNKATIPSLLQKHGKGELGVLESGRPTTLTKGQIVEIAEKRGISDRDAMDWWREDLSIEERRSLSQSAVGGAKQPVMWLNEKTPSSFTLYTHPATVLGVGLTAGALTMQASGNFSDGQVLGQNTVDVAQEKSVLSYITDFLSPNEANASIGKAVAGMVVSKVSGEALSTATTQGKVVKLLDEIFASGYVGMPVAPGQVTMNPAMKQIKTAPAMGRTVDAYNKGVGRTTTFMDGLVNMLNSPNFFASVYGKVEHKITNQMASMQSAIAHDTESGIKVVSNILTPALKGEKAGIEIAAKMKPIQDAYNEVALPLRAIEIETQKAEGVIAKLQETLGSGSDDAYINARIAEEQAKIQGLTKEYATYSKQMPAMEEAYATAKHELLTTYRTSRISYAVEEPGLMKDARYAHLYSPEEKAAVQQIQDVLAYYKDRAVGVGMPVVEGNYVRHSMDKTKLNEAFAERLKTMGINTDSKNISLSSFLERSKYSKQMIPDIQRNMLEYIPDAERRINVATLWDKTNENGWHAFSQNDLIKSNKVWNDHFEQLKKAYNPQENTLMNDLVNKYTSIETARLLFLAPSAAFKHFFKNEGTWATLGFVNSMKHIPESIEIASRNAVNESFYRLGLEKNMSARSQKDLFVRAITKQRHMLNPLDGMEKDPGVVSKVDDALQNVNSVGGVGIQMVESFDRTHTVLAALEMAAKKGMTAEQAMSSIYDTILKNNFLGGGLNPEWMRNPKVRGLMLFQGTPFKIMERRLMNAMTLGHDVKTAYGVIKSRDVATNLTELQTLGKSMLDAQNEFKQNMIYDALTAHKDAYGNSISAQFIREAVITGSVIAGGSAIGMDFHKHSLHVPFIKEGSSPELAVNPVAKAGWDTAFGPVGQDDKTFFVSRFLQKYTQTTGGMKPLMLHKMQRLSNNDIPEIYKDSAFKYLFSVPASE